MSGILALDIETVSPTVPANKRPTFEDSTDFELLAVGLGYQPEPGAPVEDVDVLFRDGWSADAELALIDDVVEWCAAYDADKLLTFNGTGFDLIHLEGRAKISGREVDSMATLENITEFIDTVDHDDLKPESWAAWGEYTSLEKSCKKMKVDVIDTEVDEYDHGLEPSTWRRPRDRGKDEVTSGDIPEFGELYLDLYDEEPTDRFDAVTELIDHYTRADIEPLFELADSRPFVEQTV